MILEIFISDLPVTYFISERLNNTEICISDYNVIYLWKYEIIVSAFISEMEI
jgi:hypothetical protein